MNGWFAIKRGTLEHDIFAPVGPWSKFEAWVWLVENAAFADVQIDIGGKPYTVKRGALCFSQRFLAGKFKWSKKAVTTFLCQLEAHGTIKIDVIKTGTGARSKRTQVTLCNYEKYQSSGAKTGPKGDQKGAKEEQDNNIPVGEADKSATSDPVKIIFDSGRALLVSAGRSSADAGKLLGMWRKRYGDANLIAAIGKAQREGAIDPVSFITGALKYSAKPTSARDMSNDELLARVL